MNARWEGRIVRAAGALGLLIGLKGLLPTATGLFTATAREGFEKSTQVQGPMWTTILLGWTLLDLVAYLALLVVSVGLLKLRAWARQPGQVLALYFTLVTGVQSAVFFYVKQGWLERLQQFGHRLPTHSQLRGADWAAALTVIYGLGLMWAMYLWSDPGPAATRQETLPGPSRERPPAKGPSAATNAPPHWPPVHVDEWMPQLPFYAQLAVVTVLLQGFKERLGSGVQIAVQSLRLYDDGVLRIPMLVDEGGKRTAVFVYSEAGIESAAHYCGARVLVRQREGMSAAYYAPRPLSPTAPARVLEQLDTPHFSRPEKERPAAEYALWWATQDEPLLRDSAALAYLDAWFESSDGYSYVLFSSFAKALELAEKEGPEEPEVYGLPVQPLMLPVDGPGDLALYLHASQEEGLWLAFDVKQTSALMRNRMLAQLAALARDVRQTVEASRGRVSARAEEQARALYFWRRARQEALDREAEGKADTRIGSIVEVGSARVRLPGASSADDRQAVASRPGPSEALTQFVREQLDRSFRLLAGRTKETDASGGPNLHPFVALRKGSDTYHVTLWSFEEPEALAFCPAIAAEHGVPEMIGLVCDGIVRIDEERFEAIVVHAQEAGDEASHVFTQRYRLAEGGAETLGNWLLKGAEAPLLSPTEAEGTPTDPSPALAALLAEIVESTLAWIRTGDGSAVELFREGEPLFSPALHFRVGDETQMRRFMMGNLAWAQAATLEELSESPQASLAVFVYDCVAELNGKPARSLRFHAHERGAPASWLYGQLYAVPVAGRRFETTGPLAFVRRGRPLFGA